jgi:hypothetical protein
MFRLVTRRGYGTESPQKGPHFPAGGALRGGDPRVKHYLDPETGLNVFTTPQRGFWGAWQLGREQIENVILRGSLR